MNYPEYPILKNETITKIYIVRLGTEIQDAEIHRLLS